MFDIASLKSHLSPETHIQTCSQTNCPGAKPKSGPRRKAKSVSKFDKKLKAAKFRMINERLYTSTGREARRYFRKRSDEFSAYHLGYTEQVRRWPVSPLDLIIRSIETGMASQLLIADLGCGEARLAKSVKNKVFSFDLVRLNSRVTVCDISKTPLSESSVDVAVFCLSLMGVNFVDYIREANRILKPGGTLIIAEVASRFDSLKKFNRALRKLGFDLTIKNTENSHFYLMHYKKTSDPGPPEQAPKISLKPCLYKKR